VKRKSSFSNLERRKTFEFLIFHLNLFFFFQGDIFSGLNDGLLSRAEALAAVDMQKHQSSHAAHQQMTQQLKVNEPSRAFTLITALCRLRRFLLIFMRFSIYSKARCHVSSWNGRTTSKTTSGKTVSVW
jgi:hypothetical protein